LNIEASKDSADITFDNDNVDLLLKPGDVKRPAVIVTDVFAAHGKDKTRDQIHDSEKGAKSSEPDVKSSEPGVKNITWKGRINKENNNVGYDFSSGNVLDTLKELKDMMMAEKSNAPKKSRFHSPAAGNTTEKEDEHDVMLEQANSIIDKVEKVHGNGEENEYTEKHPEDAKYIEKAQEILNDINSKESQKAKNNSAHSSKIESESKGESKPTSLSDKKAISEFIGETFGIETGIGKESDKGEKSVADNQNDTTILESRVAKNNSKLQEPDKQGNGSSKTEIINNIKSQLEILKSMNAQNTDLTKNSTVEGETSKKVNKTQTLEEKATQNVDQKVKNSTLIDGGEQRGNETRTGNKNSTGEVQDTKQKMSEGLTTTKSVNNTKETANTSLVEGAEEMRGVEKNKPLSTTPENDNKNASSSKAQEKELIEASERSEKKMDTDSTGANGNSSSLTDVSKEEIKSESKNDGKESSFTTKDGDILARDGETKSLSSTKDEVSEQNGQEKQMDLASNDNAKREPDSSYKSHISPETIVNELLAPVPAPTVKTNKYSKLNATIYEIEAALKNENLQEPEVDSKSETTDVVEKDANENQQSTSVTSSGKPTDAQSRSGGNKINTDFKPETFDGKTNDAQSRSSKEKETDSKLEKFDAGFKIDASEQKLPGNNDTQGRSTLQNNSSKPTQGTFDNLEHDIGSKSSSIGESPKDKSDGRNTTITEHTTADADKKSESSDKKTIEGKNNNNNTDSSEERTILNALLKNVTGNGGSNEEKAIDKDLEQVQKASDILYHELSDIDNKTLSNEEKVIKK